MAVPIFLARIAGRLKEILAINSSAGVGDADKIIATGADGKIDLTLLPSGTGPQNKTIEASESLVTNDLVNVWNDSGDVKVRKADANVAGKQAHGFVLDNYGATDPAIVYFEGEIPGLTGKTPGAYQWLSANAGEMTETPPTGAGVLSQIVGVATDDTTVQFELHEPVELAA